MEKSVSHQSHDLEIVGAEPTPAILSYWINSERRKENIIIKISKQEAQYLIANGIGYGKNGIKSTSSHYRSWYVTESKKCMYLLNKYRKENYHRNVK